MSFRDRYKGKAETVARDGSNAMLARPDAGPTQSRRPSQQGTAAAAAAAAAAPSDSSRDTRKQQQQQQQQQQGGGYYTAFQAPPPLPVAGGGESSFFWTGSAWPAPAQQSQQPHSGPSRSAAAAASSNATRQPEYRQPGGIAAMVQPHAAVARDPAQDLRRQRHNAASNNDSAHVTQHERQRAVSPGRSHLTTSLSATSTLQALSPVLREPAPSHERARRKDPLPDFSYIPPVVQHGRRAGRPQEPSPVLGNYRPHTLGEYRRLQDEIAHHRWGGLGADDNEEKRAAREKRRQMFQYGRSVNAVNFAMMELSGERAGVPDGPGLSEEGRVAKMKRERALRYGQEHSFSPSRAKKSLTPEPMSTTLDHQLEVLEQKQRQDHERIIAIKRQLGLIVSNDVYPRDEGHI